VCGITGFIGGSTFESTVAERMARQIKSRGPDDAGVWADNKASIALAHRRLSILDLSPAGHQPMSSPCGRYVLVFNGEIYNHLKIRTELENSGGNFAWIGHSDTETLLAALRHWGVQSTLERLNGMFAFALWDKKEGMLFLARDRMGEKPLYYGVIGRTFLFGSELKALKVHPDWRGEIDRSALTLFLRHNYIPAPWCIYTGIKKLPAAHYVVVRDKGLSVSEPICYWDLRKVAESGVNNYKNTDAQTLTDMLDNLMRDAIKMRMAADVPLGAFLSGGYDSSVVAALMQVQSCQPVKTFSIGFYEEAYNEAHHAKTVANHLGTDHTELYVTPDEAMAVIPELPRIYDEPFSDSSQIPTYLVSKLARRHVTVSLSGDGGDELFGGYNRYVLGYQIWQKLRLLPLPARKILSWLCLHAPGKALNTLQGVLPKRLRVQNLVDRLPKLAEVLAHRDGQTFYKDLVSHWKIPDQIVLKAVEPETLLDQQEKMPQLQDFREQMMLMDMMTYLPEDILTKVDRASMAVSLEARVPLLDHRLVEFAWQVPIEHKFKNGGGKWLLRNVLYRYLPQEMMDRPKMGFGVPLDDWLIGPLREWAENLLNEKKLREEGYFDPAPIRSMWNEHVSGRRRWHYYLWDVLMFQSWLDKSD